MAIVCIEASHLLRGLFVPHGPQAHDEIPRACQGYSAPKSADALERPDLPGAVSQEDSTDLPGQVKRAAERFFRRLINGQGQEPRWVVTDKLRSYDAAHRTSMPTVNHLTRVYANNRADVSHQPTRQRERAKRRFKSLTHAQRLLRRHGLTQNLFRVGRHLLQAFNYRLLRARAFQVWKEAAGA